MGSLPIVAAKTQGAAACRGFQVNTGPARRIAAGAQTSVPIRNRMRLLRRSAAYSPAERALPVRARRLHASGTPVANLPGNSTSGMHRQCLSGEEALAFLLPARLAR